MAPSSRITRKWEIFPGRNKFYCNGFLMTTPHNGVFFLTLILLTATSGLFFAFDCPFLATKISAAIPAIGVCLFLFTLGSLLRTSFSDPGIIPRASYDEAKYIEKQIEVPNSYNSPTYRPPPRTKEILVRGQAVKLKYCYTCKIFRPPRASHCSLCDNCVDRFDHHCPWVGNCVGKRNYRFFYMFVMSLAFLIVYVFSCSITHVILLAKENEEFIEVVKKTPFSIITATICFISVWSVIGLAGFHTYLTACEQTTNEDIKGAFSAKEGQQTTNPYSRGNLILNCFHVLCGPITPSLIDRRGVVTDAYRIQMRRPQPVQYNVPAVPTLLPQQPIGVDLEGQMINGVAMNGNAGGIGIYRQRSYDNLQNNGNNNNNNSNNVTMLVNNNNNIDEMQMSTVNHQQLQQQQQYYNQKDDSAEDTTIIENIELIGNINNNNISNNNNNNNNKNSGSCNNLFNTDDDTITSIINDNKKQLNSTTINGNNNNNISMNTTLSTTTTTGIEENVYSNIPTFKSSNIQQQNKYSKSDPNLHVYSNVATTTTTPPVTTTSSSTTNLIKSPIIKNNFHNNNNCNTTTSSSFISDELDLDDPVSVTFGGSKKTNFIYPKKLRQSISDNEGHLIKTHNNNYNNNNNNLNSNKIAATSSSTKSSSSSSSLSVLNNKTQNELLNTSTNLIQNNSSIQNSNNAINSTPSTLAVTSSTPSATTSTPATNNSNISNNNNNNNSSAFISPSRMRLLHDTTMINTALDLDSLDGSSIGNNSQACLVKMHNI